VFLSCRIVSKVPRVVDVDVLQRYTTRCFCDDPVMTGEVYERTSPQLQTVGLVDKNSLLSGHNHKKGMEFDAMERHKYLTFRLVLGKADN
jgi:hypothetical protein